MLKDLISLMFVLNTLDMPEYTNVAVKQVHVEIVNAPVNVNEQVNLEDVQDDVNVDDVQAAVNVKDGQADMNMEEDES